MDEGVIADRGHTLGIFPETGSAAKRIDDRTDTIMATSGLVYGHTGHNKNKGFRPMMALDEKSSRVFRGSPSNSCGYISLKIMTHLIRLHLDPS